LRYRNIFYGDSDVKKYCNVLSTGTVTENLMMRKFLSSIRRQSISNVLPVTRNFTQVLVSPFTACR